MPPTTNETPPPTRQCRLQQLAHYLSQVTGHTVTHDEVIDMALAEMADRAMADMMERVFGGVAAKRRYELALMIPMGRA